VERLGKNGDREPTRSVGEELRRMRSSASTFGLTEEQWDDAKAELRQANLDAAWERRMTWNGEFASHLMQKGGA
jgi:hypothetical protein